MAGKTPTELIRELQLEWVALKGQLTAVENRVEEADLPTIRERLAVVENLLTLLKKRDEEAEHRDSRLAVIESQLSEMKKREEENERRRWQLILLFFGSLLALLAQV